MPKFVFNNETDLVNAAIAIFEKSTVYSNHSERMNEPEGVAKYLLLKHKQEKYETFSAIFLNSKHQVLAFETLFNGTINCSHVYPRTVAQKALAHNAAAIIFCHHHPSGNVDFSEQDIQITLKLKEALSLVDVRVLDHFVLAGTQWVSMASQQLV